ncbi:MAG: alpha/beta fold hydrolase [Dysgonomonas sp.]
MKIEVNNIILNYIKEGAGKPVILLHGNGEDHHIFDKLIVKLKQNFTIYAIDSRNHGESQMTDDYSYETMAEDIYQFIQKLSLKDVSVIGFSDGAIISILLEPVGGINYQIKR